MIYCKAKLDVVTSAGVTPILVFDGNKLSMKQGTEDERQRNRDHARLKAEEYKRQGNEHMATRKFCEAIDITPSMAYAFILELKARGIEFYVAPYEADA
jgi:exonuclease-1